jgi:hypothetical protein
VISAAIGASTATLMWTQVMVAGHGRAAVTGRCARWSVGPREIGPVSLITLMIDAGEL